jgi:hypothetical protein
MAPEKLVEKDVSMWLRKNNFSFEIYDSKATYSLARKSYFKNANMKMGTPDIIASSPDGFFCAIELKAPKKDNVCRFEQHQFLKQKIKSNAFACVVSSSQRLEEIWIAWVKLKDNSKSEAQNYLLENLPKKVILNGKTFNV